jgi:cytochrome P450
MSAVSDAGAAPDAPVLDADPYTLENIIDPSALHEVMREAGPVVFLPKYATYATARYDEASAVLEDWQTYTSATGAGLADLSLQDAYRPLTAIVEADPPDHTAVRGVVQRIISPKVVRGWKADFEIAACRLADELADRGTVDGVKDVAEAYVTTVFPAALGIASFRENLIVAGNYTFNSHGPHNERYLAAKKAFDEVAPWFAATRRRSNLVPGGFGEQLYQAEDAGELKPGVAESLMGTFLRGGLDTTISGLGSTLMYLSRDPGLWTSLRQDRSRLKQAFEEAIRLQSPASSWYRATTRRVIIGGVSLRPGTKIQVMTAAANRDPRKWADPDTYDISRSTIGHLALGRGVHACVGQMIARLEAECLLNALLDRVERLEPRGEPVVRPLNNLRTWDSMPLEFFPA